MVQVDGATSDRRRSERRKACLTLELWPARLMTGPDAVGGRTCLSGS
jgi:hypothetical protein